MKCSEVKERALLEDWDDKERSLNPDFANHLRDCKACAEFVENTRRAACALQKTDRIAVPEDLWQGIRQNIPIESAPATGKDIFSMDNILHYIQFINPKWAMGIAAGFILIISLTGLPFKMNRLPSSHEDISVLFMDSEDEDWTEDFGSDIETYFL